MSWSQPWKTLRRQNERFRQRSQAHVHVSHALCYCCWLVALLLLHQFYFQFRPSRRQAWSRLFQNFVIDYAESVDAWHIRGGRLSIFQNPTHVKLKNTNLQNSICDSSKEPHWLTDQKSEEKYWNLTKWIAKRSFFSMKIVKVFLKQVFC